ncbi:MAG: SHOCT domain-containing protein [Candidatus Nanopelagicales bacterium]
MHWYSVGAGWNGWLMMLVMLLFWVAVVALAVWGVVHLTRTDRTSAPVESPRAILDRRFASGEIDAEEYARMRALLDERGGSPAGGRGRDAMNA